MKSICGVDCNNCEYRKNNKCNGCKESNGCPFGKQCFIDKYILTHGKEKYEMFKQQLIDEFNALNIEGMPKITELFALNGALVNLEYPLSNNNKVKFLNNDEIYLGNQVECKFNDGEVIRCYGLIGNMDFLLVSEYGVNGDHPEIILYKKR